MENRNVILAVVLSSAVLILWSMFMAPPPPASQEGDLAVEDQMAAPTTPDGVPDVSASQPSADFLSESTVVAVTREEALSDSSNRIRFENGAIRGSINLIGARIDDLELKAYKESLAEDAADIVLLKPAAVQDGYYADMGWASSTAGIALPNEKSVWQAAEPGAALSSDGSVQIYWDNGQGLTFVRRIELNEDFGFRITQTVENNGSEAVTLYPYGRISRNGDPETSGFFILHEGFLGVFDGTLEEKSYEDIKDDGTFTISSTGGWLGITDKYWLTALIPEDQLAYRAEYKHGNSKYRTGYILERGITISPGGSEETRSVFFAGAKTFNTLKRYEEKLGVEDFTQAIDWGFFFLITKPLFYALHYFGQIIGNFGVSILIVTVILKLLFYPLQTKQYQSMSKMKLIQPEMQKIKERFGDDRMAQQQAMMDLYKREKVNPLAGCLPILIQIPVFFALYKVLFVTIEMRHAPFFGWIDDLAAPDPTTIFNLFGLIPWDPSTVPLIGGLLMLGFWPIMMGVTMFLQMRMNPAPTDPIQEKVFALMPWLFMFLLASFPAGLVIYWAWNNTLSMTQQYVIMKRMGVEVHLLKNLKVDQLIARFKGPELSAGEAKPELVKPVEPSAEKSDDKS